MSKSVSFYIIESNALDFMSKIAEKLYLVGENAMFLLDNQEEIVILDTKMWTDGKLTFIPHGSRFSMTDEFIKDCKIWISDKIETINTPSCLVHKKKTVLHDFIKDFTKIIDISEHNDIDITKKTEIYKNYGFVEFKIWKQEHTSWREIDMCNMHDGNKK